jgi:hypothetical protein
MVLGLELNEQNRRKIFWKNADPLLKLGLAEAGESAGGRAETRAPSGAGEAASSAVGVLTRYTPPR